jgi:hypothetical protein
MKLTLGLGTLKELDAGRIELAFNKALRDIIEDCRDRPTDETGRKVTLTAIVTPEHIDGVLDTCQVEFEVDAKVPKRRSKAYQMQAQGNGYLIVNPVSPTNVRQGTLDDAKDGDA